MAKRSAKADKKSQRGRLRIVAGNWRSRLLDIADVPGLRPTSERIRETLFNWLTPRIAGTRCLDLFAGTGALGLEALSRGAASAVFVENSAIAANTLRKSIAALDTDAAKVYETEAFGFLVDVDCGEFDLVFLDPPFADDRLGDLCRLLQKQSILAADASVYLEEDSSRPVLELPDGWQTLKTGNAGRVRYSLVRVRTSS
ncbi:MAG: 16S rRNA (guanine(966)-N(2))-methyltransferase RsmD [Proteobacteria bacterium]|nr:16S rRNA (guanine(966)-N(2))-methyltransferase RsmD [Pseudomonadota bacterium]